VELTEGEQVIQEWFESLLDQGHSPDIAISYIRGTDISAGLRSPRPKTEELLSDNDFIRYLTD
jgi:hypothetical protein